MDGKAATFNGTNAPIRIPAIVVRNFSIECRVKTTATAAGANRFEGMGLVYAEVGGVVADFGPALLNGKAAFGSGNPVKATSSAKSINDGIWHHVAATLNSESGLRKIYIDGIPSATQTLPAGPRNGDIEHRVAKIPMGMLDPKRGFVRLRLETLPSKKQPLRLDPI